MQVGGGLLAGAALLAGGYAAFKSHEKDEEEVRDSYSPHSPVTDWDFRKRPKYGPCRIGSMTLKLGLHNIASTVPDRPPPGS
jgi:hypothetical protein